MIKNSLGEFTPAEVRDLSPAEHVQLGQHALATAYMPLGELADGARKMSIELAQAHFLAAIAIKGVGA